MKVRSGHNPFVGASRPLGVSGGSRAYRVLLIDDSVFIRKQLAQILSSEGFEILGEAGDGLEGLQLYKAHFPKVDLVTIDVTMPRMDGITCLENIRSFDPQARAIMVTTIGSNDVVKQALGLGAVNYIVKPLDRDKVLQRVVKCLAN